MASSFEKSVKGATKIKAAPPKTKYIEHILIATHAGEAGVGEVFRALQHRLRDSTWTVVFKSLITVHLMIREGSPDVTLAYLSKHRNMLAISMFSDAQTQGRNIRHYSSYLSERARAYRDTKVDWVRAKESRLEKLSIDKGLLRETEAVQDQLNALLKCDVMDHEPENEITITVFRLLVLDLLALFQALNQALINILSHFFEMSKPDAERALEIYRTFSRQTDFVVQYLVVARQYEHHTRVEVPKLKHAPVNLGRQLEEYLRDPDFEVHRRQYLAELAAKKSKGGGAGSGGGGGSSYKIFSSSSAAKAGASKTSAASATNGAAQQRQPTQAAAKSTDLNLIDFFDSIEQHQTTTTVQPNIQSPAQVGAAPTAATAVWGAAAGIGPVMNPGMAPGMSPGMMTNMNMAAANSNMAFQTQPTGQIPSINSFAAQTTGFQVTNPFQQQQGMGTFTGTGFGGFAPQPNFQPSSLSPIPQESVATFPTGPSSTLSALNLQTGQQTTNPFRQSLMMSPTAAGGAGGAGLMGSSMLSAAGSPSQSNNPFARSVSQATAPSPFLTQAPNTGSAAATPLQPMATGTNPFARAGVAASPRPATSSGALLHQPTGSTNPFRQGAFVNHATGMGWQHNQQPIGGGLDQLESIPVFPRPAASSPWQT